MVFHVLGANSAVLLSPERRIPTAPSPEPLNSHCDRLCDSRSREDELERIDTARAEHRAIVPPQEFV